MIIARSPGLTLPQQASPVLAQTPSEANGEFGFAITTALLLGGGLLLGSGGLWQLNKKREERTDYLGCVEKYTSAPYNMPPSEAAMVCSGQPVGGFEFGLNAKTAVLMIGSVFGMWFLTQFLLSAAKSKLGGKKQ